MYTAELQCCPGYGPIPTCLRELLLLFTDMSIIIAICETPCGLYEECSTPNNCTCIAGRIRTENGTECEGTLCIHVCV